MTGVSHFRVWSAGLALVLGLLCSPARAEEEAGLDHARRLACEGELAKAVDAARASLGAAPADLAAARLLQDLLDVAGRSAERDALPDAIESPRVASYLRVRTSPVAERIKALRDLRGSPDGPAFAHLDLAWAYLDGGRPREAASAAKGYLKLDPLDAEAHEALGRAELARGSPREAQAPLERSLVLDPARWGAAIVLAEVHHRLRAPDKARVLLLEAVERYRGNVNLQLALAGDLMRTDELAAAEKGLDKQVLLRPRDLRVLVAVGKVKRRLGKIPDAESAARQIVAIDENHAEGRELLGFVLEKQGKLEEALEQYFLAVRAAPEWPDAHVGVAFVQILLGELEYADQAVKRALKLEKNHPGAHLSQGILEYLNENNRLARKHLELVLKRDPKNVPAHRYLGYVLLDDGKAKAALDHFEEIMELEPADAGAVRMAGRITLELGEKVEKAVEILKRAVELGPDDPWTHFDLGKALDAQEEYKDAAASYRKAIALDAEFTWPHLHLAELLDEAERDFRNALVHYKRFLELGGPDPDDEIVKRIKVIEGD